MKITLNQVSPPSPWAHLNFHFDTFGKLWHLRVYVHDPVVGSPKKKYGYDLEVAPTRNGWFIWNTINYHN